MASLAELFAFSPPYGSVWPPRPSQPLPDKDAREYALERFALFISLLVFRRTMAPGQKARGFRIPRQRVHVYQPDDVEDVAFPAVAFIPGRGYHEEFGLGPAMPIEETADVYAPGTVLVRQSDYVETFTVEVLSAKHAIRRSVIAGLKQVLRSSEERLSTDLVLPDYYDQVAQFSMAESEYIEGPETVKNRRIGHLYVELRVPEVFLTNYVPLVPIVDLGGPDQDNVFDGNVWLDFGETRFGPEVLRPRCEGDL